MPTRPATTVDAVVAQQSAWSATVTSNDQRLLLALEQRPIAPAQYTTTTLPAAGTYLNCICVISDAASGKGPLVYSDGTVWRYASDTSAV